jgi:tryptophan halogenase
MIQNLVVLGAGSAGLLAALTLKRLLPTLNVRVVRSPDLGVIGVGEGTTTIFPQHLFDHLKIPRVRFYAHAEPTWKLGVRFLWGPREEFYYTFSNQLDVQRNDLPVANGFYCDAEFQNCDLPAALMAHGKVFARQPSGGGPDIQPWHGFHIENRKLVEVLEAVTLEAGVEITDATIHGVELGPQGVAALVADDDRRITGDFFIDASGFRSELLGRALEEPYVSYDKSLFCDRAVVGGWERTTEPILPYTTAETMDAGWAWQIEHEHHVNRGYVYASQSISDEDAWREFLRKNPKAPASPRVVKFRSGRYRRLWRDNVVAIGNSGGFVEPLEATALTVAISQVRNLVEVLRQSRCQPTATMRDVYNSLASGGWDDVRDFLALHYLVNTRLDTSFWRHCRADTDPGGLGPLLAFYAENGPSLLGLYALRTVQNGFGLEGFLSILIGNRVPYAARYEPTARERQVWNQHRANCATRAQGGMDVAEALQYVRHPAWQWFS